jgi:hypothetical protein
MAQDKRDAVLGWSAFLNEQGCYGTQAGEALLERAYGLSPDQTPTTIQQLLALPYGREWWKQYGGPLKLTFVLDPASESVKNMLRYLRE